MTLRTLMSVIERGAQAPTTASVAQRFPWAGCVGSTLERPMSAAAHARAREAGRSSKSYRRALCRTSIDTCLEASRRNRGVADYGRLRVFGRFDSTDCCLEREPGDWDEIIGGDGSGLARRRWSRENAEAERP